MADIYYITPHFLAYKVFKNSNSVRMTGIKENAINHCYRADKRNTLLELNLKIQFIKYGWGGTLKNQRMDIKYRKLK